MFEMTLLNVNPLSDKIECILEGEEISHSKLEILADICETFELSKNIEFNVIGFGLEKWPVDCMYDLLCVIEMLPNIINGFFENNYDFILDFYEQGLERTLFFEKGKNIIRIKCESRTKWISNPQTEFISIRRFGDDDFRFIQ